MAEETHNAIFPNGIQELNLTDDQNNLSIPIDEAVVITKPALVLETNNIVEVEGLAPPEVEDVDASPGVQEDVNGLRNILIGQATTSTHRDSPHYDISGKKLSVP